MAKVRVYELAKELGLESKELLAKLKDMGEFVRSASSTIEAPVVRRVTEKVRSERTGGDGDSSSAAKPAAEARPARSSAPTNRACPRPRRSRPAVVETSTSPSMASRMRGPRPGTPTAPSARDTSVTSSSKSSTGA